MSVELSRVDDVFLFGGTQVGPTKEGPWYPLADGIALLNSLPVEDRQVKRMTKLGVPVPASCTYIEAKKLIHAAEGLLPPTTECLQRMAALGLKADPSWNRDQCNAVLNDAKPPTVQTTPNRSPSDVAATAAPFGEDPSAWNKVVEFKKPT
jgi:hypothetical protein